MSSKIAAKPAAVNDGVTQVSVASVAPAEQTPRFRMPSNLGEGLSMVHRALRGRYIVVVLLALIGCAAGGYAGYKIMKPTYQSEGLLKIAYTLPQVMGPTDQNEAMAQFDTYMQSQRQIIASHRILDLAVQAPGWAQVSRDLPDKPDRWFAEHLTVDIKPRSEFIVVRVTDSSPARAAEAANAVMNAYADVYQELENDLSRQRSTYLTRELDTAQKKVADVELELNGALDKASKQYGSADLEVFYQAAQARIVKLDAALDAIRLAIAAGGAAADAAFKAAATQPVAAAEPKRTQLTREELAQRDPEMRRLLIDEENAKAEIKSLTLRGIGSAHKSMLAAQEALKDASARVAKQEREAREFQEITGQNLADPRNNGGQIQLAGRSLLNLKEDEARLEALRASAKGDLLQLSEQRRTVKGIQARLDTAREEATKLANRVALLNAEKQMNGRLRLISSAAAPQSPARDQRLKAAAVGALGGFCFPIGAFIALGLLRGRYLHSDEPISDIASSIPLLGILPELDDADDDQRSAAAHCIHQIRVLLRSRTTSRRSSVYLVTSATAGEGKTSFTTSLGLSFAASGMRTLIIDGDLVGRALTHSLKASKEPGLWEALDEGCMKRRIRRLDESLYVMTSGSADSGHAAGLECRKVAALLAEARRFFNVILIDSGPILGSLEAAVVAPEADEAIMLISRGQQRGLVRNAIRKLRSLNVRTAGFVYNRATLDDFAESPYGSSSRSMSSNTMEDSHAISVPRAHRLKDMGPLVDAVNVGGRAAATAAN